MQCSLKDVCIVVVLVLGLGSGTALFTGCGESEQASEEKQPESATEEEGSESASRGQQLESEGSGPREIPSGVQPVDKEEEKDPWEIPGGPTSPEEREKLKKRIRKEAREQARKQITKKKVAEKLGFDWPVDKTTKSKEEIKKEVQKMVQEKVDEKYPMSKVEEFEEEAKEKSPLLKKGDRTTFTLLRPGRGKYVRNEPFLGKSSRRVHVGEQWIPRIDIPQHVETRFYPELNEEYRRDYVRKKTRQYKYKRQDYAEKIREKITEKKFKEANYAFDEAEDKWVSRRKLLEKATTHFSEKKAEKLKPEITQRVMRKNGYRKKDGEWKPESMFDL